MKLTLSALLSAVLLLPAGALAQEPVPADGEGQDLPDLLLTTDLDRLFEIYFRKFGGREKLQELKRLSFQVDFFSVDPQSGAESRASGKSSLRVELRLQGGSRMVRMEHLQQMEQGGERLPVVRLSDGLTVGKVWVEGEQREIDQLSAGAILDGRFYLGLLDLLYAPDSADLQVRIEGIKKRSQIEYLATHAEFRAMRGFTAAYRTFYNPSSSLVERIDSFDLRTYRLESTMLLGDYVSLAGVHLPLEWTFQDALGRSLEVWRISKLVVNPELDPLRFETL